jgi:pimeloyl-ACP methyl ester carboxylesterase
MAVEIPGRVSRMALLSPGPPFAAVRWQMFARMVPLFIRPTPRMFYWNLQWLTTLRLDPEQPDPLAELFVAGALSFRPDELSFGSYPTFDDHTLRAISIPTLLLTGDHERVVSPHKVIDRAARLMPRIETGLIGDAGHLLPVDQPEEVNARVLAFLTAPG